jgi:ribosome biogenesis GTPase
MRDEYDELYGETRRAFRKERKERQARDRTSPIDRSSSNDDPIGRVISIDGNGILVSLDGEERLCSARGRLKQGKSRQTTLVVLGDLVRVDGTSITAVEPRRSLLARADNLRRRNQQLIAANVDQVFIVVSLLVPSLKPALVDRYRIAAESGGIEPIIVLNKIDLLTEPPDYIAPEDVEAERLLKERFVAAYSPVIEVSATKREGIDAITAKMRGKTSVFAGQSGVGKSSLLSEVLDLTLPTGDVVRQTRKGSHTTTKATLLPLAEGGFCIDTPGIKSFGLWDIDPKEVSQFFPEIREYGGQCRFADCTHIHEPGCVVRDAVESGAISSLRYDSYCTLRQGEL